MKNQITDYLQISSLQYEDQTFAYYLRWCDTRGLCPKEVQKLLANASISKWFMYEFSKLENDFCQALPFLIKSKKDLKHEYQAIVGNIYTIYPQPLINAVVNTIGKEPRQKIEVDLQGIYTINCN